jgi:hypothetical protein
METAEDIVILLVLLIILFFVLWMAIRQDRKDRKIRSGRYKHCPFCNKEIRKRATVCKHCKSEME